MSKKYIIAPTTNSKKDSDLLEIVESIYEMGVTDATLGTDDWALLSPQVLIRIQSHINSKYITKEVSDRRVLEGRIKELENIDDGAYGESDEYPDEYGTTKAREYIDNRIAELRELLNGGKEQ